MKTMKLTYLFVFAMLFITSCSSDETTSEEEAATPTEPTLIGEWTGVSSTYNGIDFGDPENNFITFTEDDIAEFTYLEFGDNGEDVIREATYNMQDDVLVIEWQGNYKDMESMSFKIISLSEDTLVIQYNITQDGVIEETYTRVK